MTFSNGFGVFTISKWWESFQDLFWIKAPQLFGAYAVPEYTGKPEGDANFDGAEYYIMRVATCQVYSEKNLKVFVIDIFENF